MPHHQTPNTAIPTKTHTESPKPTKLSRVRGTAIAANKVPGVRAATAHDLLTVRGSVENYDAQILCMGQNVIAAPAAWALIDIWLDLHHDPTSSYGPKVGEIAAYEAHLHS